MKKEISIKEVAIEIDGILINIFREKKDLIKVFDAAAYSEIISIDMKKVRSLSKRVKKYESIESCDILCAMIVDRLRTGQGKQFKNVNQFLKDKDFLELCFDSQMNYIGSVLESIE